MAVGAWFAHFRAPVLISPFQNHLRYGLRRAIDRDVDLRREVADGRDGLARFIDGVVREPVDEVVGHALE